MAVTSATYTGNGSTTNYSFTFEYIKQSDVKATLDGTATTAFTFANATTLSFNTAPANGVAIRIFRDTDINTLEATFFPGSAIKAEDLNNNFTQNNFAAQETDNDVIDAKTTAASAVTTADGAVTTANNAVTTANGAVTTANTASTNASNAVTTANAAQTTVTTYVHDGTNPAGDGVGSNPQGLAYAINTANSASTSATNAVNTANTAATDATTAVNTANAATTTANGAVTTANNAATTATAATNAANAAQADANTANTTANGAVTTANAASATANTANTNATNAVNTANTANATANAASAAVANALFYTPIANVAAIPGSPSNQDRYEIADSTGIQSFTPLSGVPSGFTGSSDLTVRIEYDSSATSWTWKQYFAADPEARYATISSVNTNTTAIATKMPLAGGTFTGAVSFDDNVIARGDSTNGSGAITLNCEVNTHGIKIKGPPHSAGASYTLVLPNSLRSTTSTIGTITDTAADIPTGTTAQRPSSPAAGQFRFNSTDSKFEGYDGSDWGEIGGGGAAIIDGGDFNSASSIAGASTQTFDGGEFT